jgi:hypothetical protein
MLVQCRCRLNIDICISVRINIKLSYAYQESSESNDTGQRITQPFCDYMTDHVAQNLGAVNTDPVERGMRKGVTGLILAWRLLTMQLHVHVIPGQLLAISHKKSQNITLD